MADFDRHLQAAIFASLKDAQRPSAARPFAAFRSASRDPGPRRHSQSFPQPRSRDPVGTLQREGIVPANTSAFGGASPSTSFSGPHLSQFSRRPAGTSGRAQQTETFRLDSTKDGFSSVFPSRSQASSGLSTYSVAFSLVFSPPPPAAASASLPVIYLAYWPTKLAPEQAAKAAPATTTQSPTKPPPSDPYVAVSFEFATKSYSLLHCTSDGAVRVAVRNAHPPPIAIPSFHTASLVLLEVRSKKLWVTVNECVLFKDVSFPAPYDPSTLPWPGVAARSCRVKISAWDATPAPNIAVVQCTSPAAQPDSEEAELQALIERDIIRHDVGVTFDDIAGLELPKRVLTEAVVLPLLVPGLFTGIRQPWKGILLYGPPGTGKTLLAKAVAAGGRATFFNCSAATLVSKWRGESEKLLRCLFATARKHAPSILFFDEVDALLSARGAPSEHEASRRFKAEILQQMDGVGTDSRGVLVLAATNTPWDLDEALCRRLEKRIYVPPPDLPARVAMFRLHLNTVTLHDDVSFEELGARTEGYSGSDIQSVCRDAAMAPVRRLMHGNSPEHIKHLQDTGTLPLTVTMADLLSSLSSVKATLRDRDNSRFLQWDASFGSH